MMAERQVWMENIGMPWGPDDTERYLKDHPLPGNFTWRGQVVCPRYRLKKGYGFWLRTTPYHPGLFEALNGFMARCDHYPTEEEMVDAMQALERAAAAKQEDLKL